MRRLSRTLVVLGLVAGSLVAAPPAHALFHLMKITEVFAGASSSAAAQFIEMQMYSENQRFLSSHEVVVYDETGAEAGSFTFTSPVENGAAQAHILLATPEAEELFGVTADLAIDAVIAAGGGKACFMSSQGEAIDCASWGDYSGDDAGSGTPFNSPVGLVLDQSMTRRTGGGEDPEGLDEGDDTDDSAADFELASPSPTNNAGSASETEDHERSVTLKLRSKAKLVGSGRVSSEHQPCVEQVVVKLQRKASGRWRTVKEVVTEADGSFSAKTKDRPGSYRAKVPETVPAQGHRCLVAVSPVRKVE